MLNRIHVVQECDANTVDKRYSAGFKKIPLQMQPVICD
jgi:hypothetical protein